MESFNIILLTPQIIIITMLTKEPFNLILALQTSLIINNVIIESFNIIYFGSNTFKKFHKTLIFNVQYQTLQNLH
jgi:hypothetical protein